MKREFLDLGKQPIANNFITSIDEENEFIFDLKVVFDDETTLVSLKDFVAPELMFNENYAYHSSMSYPMKKHYKDIAGRLICEFNPKSVLEIGSNDGIFLKHFDADTTFAVEPCSNFAEMTNDMGYKTYPNFWTTGLSENIKTEDGMMDLIYASNCICHIQDLDDTFKAVHSLLSEGGIFVFEDPSLLEMLNRVSYDQIYDEHAHIFSVMALGNLLKRNGMEIFRVENLTTHGGSNRIYAKLTNDDAHPIDSSFYYNLGKEVNAGIGELSTYQDFANKVWNSKIDLISILTKLKLQGKKIISYGATSKSTTVFNYCGIDADLIDYIIDTTPDKQGKYSPGKHIPIISPEEGFDDSVDVAFLGAWNFKDVILEKESEFINRGGQFIVHVPRVEII
jgi:methylation protein EvaC